jgi:hypothetical protein
VKSNIEGRLFFSEEKKQKTFVSPLLPRSGQWQRSLRQRGNKSFLVLFFKQERLCHR